MLKLNKAVASTLGQKFLMAITGLALVLFVIFHLFGNLTILAHDPNVFNVFSDKLVSLGTILNILELTLLALALIHISLALRLKWLAFRARPIGYAEKHSKGRPSKYGLASARMVPTGFMILVFLVIHLTQFKFGPGIAEGYKTIVNGEMIRDLHRVEFEAFSSISTVIFYVACMLFLGFHLRHGVWSSFQSLGGTNSRTSQPIYRLGGYLAIFLVMGFLIIPIWVYLKATGVL